MTPRDVLQIIKDKKIEFVDFKLTDVPGSWQHITIPISEIDEGTFKNGVAFDGSSVRGFRSIEESDMLMIPDPATAMIDPFIEVPTLSVICDVYTPAGDRYERCPRTLAKKAEEYLKSTGLADVSYWGPELEFFIFDDVRYECTQNSSFYFLDSEEAVWNTGKAEGPNLGYKIRNKMGYFPVAPHDTQTDIRSEMVKVLQDCGVRVERHHHEVATAGQNEINFRFDSLTNCADRTLLFKYVVRNVSRRHGKTATFMPKPLYGDNGSGMHVHQSLYKGGENLFYGKGGYGNLSQTALYYIGGILKHAPALLAFTNPSTNSYKRLVPGYEAPVNLVFSKGNRSASVRIPISAVSPKTARIEFRTPDCTTNPYIAFTAMLLAGVDGIKNKIDPMAAGYGPIDKNIYKLSAGEKAQIRAVPGSLEEAFSALEADQEFLLQGEIFTKEFIQTWIDLKREEIDAVKLRPHPMEFAQYFDA